MSSMFCLVVEDSFSMFDAIKILKLQKLYSLNSNNDQIEGIFEKSKMKFLGNYNNKNIYADEYNGNFKIGLTFIFHYVNGKHYICGHEIQNLLNNIVKNYNCFFVFSFQFEKVFSVRDENGHWALSNFF